MSRIRDIGPLIDNGAWSGYQKLLLLLVSLAVLLDGFDNQSLGFALPSILQDWGLAKADLAPALAAAQFGMLIGAVGGGAVGDRVGRKIALVASTVLFGVTTLLVESGHDIAVASRGLAAFNMGGVVTALMGGWAIGQFGSKRTIVAMAVAAAFAALLLAVVPGYTGSVSVLFILLALEGGFINGVQTTLYALASHIYPTAVRARGVGTATGLGRTGAVTSSLLGAVVIGMGGAVAFHWSIAAVMLIVGGSLIMIKRHSIPIRR